jgi:amino acid transporter
VTDIAIPDRRGYRVKRKLLGNPLHTEDLEHERLGKPTALAVFASDNLSSSAYATEEILHVLVPAIGLAAFSLVVPITVAMLVVLGFLILSYRETIKEYPSAGGAYLVTKDNFGIVPAQVAGASLLTDYVLTVAVSTSAGTAALVSAFEVLEPFRVPIALGFIAIITFGNLRGVRESGKVFAVPTYFFMVNMVVLLAVGVTEALTGNLEVVGHHAGMVEFGQGGSGLLMGASLFVVLHAFASGGAAVTGVEAISNGVPAFKKPEWRNARQTLVIMGTGLGVMFLGLSYLASKVKVAPYESGTPTVIAQVGEAVYGHGLLGEVLFYSLQAGTMLILVLAANTGFADFPRLASFQAGDRFLPRQLTKRGHRLVYSNGVLALAGAAAVLVVLTGAEVTRLIPLYAIGVFTGFTLSQAGMTKHHLRKKEPGWQKGIAVNGFGALLSAIVALIIAVTKFADGAWVILIALPLLVVLFLRVHRQYEGERRLLESDDLPAAAKAPLLRRHVVLVFVDKLDMATARAIQYARTLTPDDMRAVHFAVDPDMAAELAAAWAKTGLQRVTLDLVDCPDRRLISCAVELVARELSDGDTEVSVLLPDRKYGGLWHRILHDQTADGIERAVSRLAHANVTTVPFHFGPHGDQRGIRQKLVALPAGRDGGDGAGGVKGPPPAPTTDERGVAALGGVRWRQRVTVEGRVTTLRASPTGEGALLEVVVSDDSGSVSLVFNGRRRVAGIELGTTIRAEGTVARHRGRLAIFNPVYNLRVGASVPS